MPRKSMYSSRWSSPKGVVSVWSDRLDPHPSGPWRRRQIGHRWDKGFLVTVERWDEGGWGDPLHPWSDWVEVSRTADRVRPKRRPIVPEMTEEELDAWSEHVRPYVEQEHGTTIARVAGLLDGWDDVQSFWPGRKPHDYSGGLLWDWRDGTTPAPARQRSYALARAALQRLVKRGLARQAGSNWWVRPGY